MPAAWLSFYQSLWLRRNAEMGRCLLLLLLVLSSQVDFLQGEHQGVGQGGCNRDGGGSRRVGIPALGVTSPSDSVSACFVLTSTQS